MRGWVVHFFSPEVPKSGGLGAEKLLFHYLQPTKNSNLRTTRTNLHLLIVSSLMYSYNPSTRKPNLKRLTRRISLVYIPVVLFGVTVHTFHELPHKTLEVNFVFGPPKNCPGGKNTVQVLSHPHGRALHSTMRTKIHRTILILMRKDTITSSTGNHGLLHLFLVFHLLMWLQPFSGRLVLCVEVKSLRCLQRSISESRIRIQ